MSQSIKDTVLEIKEIIFGEHDIDIEGYAEELSNRSSLSFDEIKDVFNNLTMVYMQSKNPKLNQTKKKIWDKCEDDLMLQYVELSTRSGISKRDSLLDLVDILVNRSESSIPFRYYNIATKKDNSDNLDNSKKALKYVEAKVSEESKPESKDDLLDMVVDIVDNVDTVGIDVDGLFKGILTLSRRAVENSNVAKVDDLEGQVAFLNSELDKERENNLSLQEDVSKLISDFEELKNEFEYFNGLNGKQKLQQLQNYNKKMKYIIDKFGGVIAVGL